MRVIHVLRKPISEGNVATNVLKHGCGGMNTDGCRVEWQPRDLDPATNRTITPGAGVSKKGFTGNPTANLSVGVQIRDVPYIDRMSPLGRWPANLILEHLPGCRRNGTKKVKGNCPPRSKFESWLGSPLRRGVVGRVPTSAPQQPRWHGDR